MGTSVANLRKAKYDVYIGRQSFGMHFGNPFSHLANSLASVKVASREEAVACFETWLRGIEHAEVEPERRLWILNSLPMLKGKVLGCYCFPKACHGDVLAKMAEASDDQAS
jgi:hypothetical protein